MSHITNRSQNKEDKGNQDNTESKLILKKTIVGVLGKIREDFAHMKKIYIILRSNQNIRMIS